MRRILLVHGLKRSGNHAIINWLLAQGRFEFLNNIVPVAPILEGKREMPSPVPFKNWLATQYEGGFLATLASRWRLRLSDLVASLEDHDLGTRPFLRPPVPVQEVLILREPENLFASRIRKASRVDNPAYANEAGAANDRAVSLWKQHAHAFLEADNTADGPVGILYDAWHLSSTYRRRISSQLGLHFSDDGLHSVSQEGGGSSFDGTQFDGRGQDMAVLRRGELLDDQERRFLDSILRDSEVATLAQALARRKAELAQ